MPTKRRLLLVDAYGLIYRAFHALPPLTNSRGQLTNAAYGFTSILLRTMTDVDPVALYRGQYTDEDGARATMLALSGGGLRAVWNAALGPAMNNTRFAKRGDVVLVEVGGVEATGIVAGSRVACLSEAGLLMVPAHRIVAAWSV